MLNANPRQSEFRSKHRMRLVYYNRTGRNRRKHPPSELQQYVRENTLIFFSELIFFFFVIFSTKHEKNIFFNGN